MIFQDRDINNSDRTLSVFLLKLSGPAQIWATSLWMKFNSGLDQNTFMVSSYCRSSIKSTVYTILKVSFLSFISLPALYERQKQKLLMSNFASMCGVLQLFMQHDKASSWHWWLYNGHHSDRKAVVRGWMAGTLCLLPLLLPLCISEYSTTVSIFNCRFLLHNSVCII